MDSLTNLAFSNSPRATFFRKELERIFITTREQHLKSSQNHGFLCWCHWSATIYAQQLSSLCSEFFREWQN